MKQTQFYGDHLFSHYKDPYKPTASNLGDLGTWDLVVGRQELYTSLGNGHFNQVRMRDPCGP